MYKKKFKKIMIFIRIYDFLYKISLFYQFDLINANPVAGKC
jgi:hypothetical protein